MNKIMLIDFHTHLFPKDMRQNREKYFEGEPGFQMLYASEKAKLIGGEKMLRVMDDEGVDVSVVFGFPWKNQEYARQHNDYIMEVVAKRLDIPPEKVIVTVHKYGNTSAASIPTTLDEGVRDSRIKRGDLILVDSFGAGFTWGAALFRY